MAGRKSLAFFLSLAMRTAMAQVPEVTPHVMTKADAEGTVTVVEVATHFVTAIRMPETVNSVVVGDPTQFQVEHSDREPELVFIKALTPKPAETNLLISTSFLFPLIFNNSLSFHQYNGEAIITTFFS